MKHVKKQDLEIALKLLEISKQELDECKDLRKLELRTRKRWHPDRVIGLGLDKSQVIRFTRVSQKIPTCFEIFKYYKNERKKESKKKARIRKQKQNRNEILLRKLILLVNAGKKDEAEKLAARSMVEATLNNDKTLIKEFLKFGTDIDGGFTGLPPLCFAVKENNLEMVQFLLSMGASANSEMNGNRVIVFALENRNIELVEILLKAGANPNKYNSQVAKWTPLIGGNVKWTLLMDRIATDDISFIKLLVEFGANINAITFEPGWSSLLEAVKNERIDIVKYLLLSGADPTYKNKNGISAYHLARNLGNEELMQILQGYLN